MTTTDSLKTLNDWTNKHLERMTSLGELNMRLFEKLATRQMDAMSLYLEHSLRLMKLATEAKGYTELFKGQVEAGKELTERMFAEGKVTLQIWGEARDDYRAWLEKSMSELGQELRQGSAV
ncbi:phasin family protein [Caldichromatium japonicum]|uniref:Phasin family protein n=1 Tax=Caldichromatium japonicum TaxID=2699430 RepID=A0A6G7VAE5_9GAMM|nr:phasin family protein [Caldichromatium japonicum]QIK37043.1 phasin family protein [Caldichromatium japonicum]